MGGEDNTEKDEAESRVKTTQHTLIGRYVSPPPRPPSFPHPLHPPPPCSVAPSETPRLRARPGQAPAPGRKRKTSPAPGPPGGTIVSPDSTSSSRANSSGSRRRWGQDLLGHLSRARMPPPRGHKKRETRRLARGPPPLPGSGGRPTSSRNFGAFRLLFIFFGGGGQGQRGR